MDGSQICTCTNKISFEDFLFQFFPLYSLESNFLHLKTFLLAIFFIAISLLFIFTLTTHHQKLKAPKKLKHPIKNKNQSHLVLCKYSTAFYSSCFHEFDCHLKRFKTMDNKYWRSTNLKFDMMPGFCVYLNLKMLVLGTNLFLTRLNGV